VAAGNELGVVPKLPPALVDCIMFPRVPTAQLSEELTMYTEVRMQPHGATVFPLQVLPSYHKADGVGTVVPPTAHPEDPPVRKTPNRADGFTRGATKGALVQLKDPPFHLSTVGIPVPGSGVPTAHPSESLYMKTESSSSLFGEVVVLQIESDCEPQLFRQNAASPTLPTAQIFPPEVANVTALSPPFEAAIWLIGIRVQLGALSNDNPCRIAGGAPGASPSPTAQASDELSMTIDLRLFGAPHDAGLAVPAQVFPSVVRMIVHRSPTAQPTVDEDIATPNKFVPGTGVAAALQVPQSVSMVPASPTATP
jgi:hypothetical protein